MRVDAPSVRMLKRMGILESYLMSQGFSFEIVRKGRYGHGEGEDAIGIFRKNNLTITIGSLFNITYVYYSNEEGSRISHRKYMETLSAGSVYKYHDYHSNSEFADITHDLKLYGQDFFEGGKRIREALEKEERSIEKVEKWREIFIKKENQTENESILTKANQLFQVKRYKETIQLLKGLPQLSAWGKKLLEIAKKKTNNGI